jgi:hypothetical protein
MPFNQQEPYSNPENSFHQMEYSFQTPKTTYLSQFRTPTSAICSTPNTIVDGKYVQYTKRPAQYQKFDQQPPQLQLKTPNSVHTPARDFESYDVQNLNPNQSNYVPTLGLGIEMDDQQLQWLDSPPSNFHANMKMSNKIPEENHDVDSMLLFDDFVSPLSYLPNSQQPPEAIFYSDYGNQSDGSISYDVSAQSLPQLNPSNSHQATTSGTFGASPISSIPSAIITPTLPCSGHKSNLITHIEPQSLLSEVNSSSEQFDMLLDFDSSKELSGSEIENDTRYQTTCGNIDQRVEHLTVSTETDSVTLVGLGTALETKPFVKQVTKKPSKKSLAKVSKKSSPKSLETTVFAVNSQPRRVLEKSLSFSECSKNFPLYSNTYSFVFENGGDDDFGLRKTKSQANLRVLHQHYQYDHYRNNIPKEAPKILKNMKSGLIEFQIDLDKKENYS